MARLGLVRQGLADRSHLHNVSPPISPFLSCLQSYLGSQVVEIPQRHRFHTRSRPHPDVPLRLPPSGFEFMPEPNDMLPSTTFENLSAAGVHSTHLLLGGVGLIAIAAIGFVTALGTHYATPLQVHLTTGWKTRPPMGHDSMPGRSSVRRRRHRY